MLLPATGVELPSENFSLKSFKEYKDESTERNMSFVADILHKPTKLVVAVGNTGRNEEHDYDVCTATRKTEAPRDTAQAVLTEWDTFVRDCLPILREQAQNQPAGWEHLSDMYNGEDHRIEYLRDAVLDLFLAERSAQARLSRQRGVVFRKMEIGGDLRTFVCNDPNPENLRGRGHSYWDKKAKNWVSL